MAKRTTKRSAPRKTARGAPAKKPKTVRAKARVRVVAKPKKAARPVVRVKAAPKAKVAAKPAKVPSRKPAPKPQRIVETVAPLPAVASTVEPAPEEMVSGPTTAATNGPTTSSLELVVKEVEASLPGITKDEALDVAVDALAQVAHYNWVGIYLLDGDTLVLGPYRGAETEHVRIPIGQGICGLAARTAQTVNVPDVNKDPRYLACFLNTRSELVVPIFDPHGHVVGEIDIDSDTANAFTQVDESVVERIARLLSPFFVEPETEASERFLGTN